MLISYIGLLIAECIIIYVFWKKIIQQRVKSNHRIVTECKKLFLNFFKVYYRGYINAQLEIEEDKKLLEEAKRIILEIIICGSALLSAPLVGSGLIYYQSANEEIIFKIFWAVLVCWTLGWYMIKELTKYEDRVVENVYFIWQINRLLEDYIRDLRHNAASGKKNIQWKIVLSTIAISVPLFLICVEIDEYVNDNGHSKVVMYGFAAIAGIWICFCEVSRKKKEKDKYKADKKQIIIKGEYLQQCKNEIESMCKMQQITDIEITEEYGVSAIAQAVCGKNEPHRILVDTQKLMVLEKNYSDEAVKIVLKLIVAHELIHISYGDPQSIRRSKRKAALISLGVLGIFAGCLFLVQYFPAMLWEACFILIMETIYSKLFGDKRYWLQLQEIRADKLGMELAGIPNDMVNQINSILWNEGNETDPDGHIYHFYKRYISGQGEISVKRRLKASAIYFKWGSFYYIWLAKEIVVGLIKKEGWYGEQ